MVEGAPLLREYRLKRLIEGSNPSLSAINLPISLSRNLRRMASGAGLFISFSIQFLPAGYRRRIIRVNHGSDTYDYKSCSEYGCNVSKGEMHWSLPIPAPRCSARIGLRSTGNGVFAMTMRASIALPSQIKSWPMEIKVPFPPESKASGIADRGFHPLCWYQRDFECLPPSGRVILRFGAVDYCARVWVNGCLAVTHEGGHTPFWADITNMLDPSGKQTVTVQVEDDPHELAKPRGKQDWQLSRTAIWYPRTTGIWQTVWLERVPDNYIEKIRWTPARRNLCYRLRGPGHGRVERTSLRGYCTAARRTAARA